MPAEQSANTICAPVASGPRFPLWGLLALATAALIDVMTDLLPAGVLPQMSGALHVPPERIGVLVSAFAVASSVAAIPVTTALRGLPRRPVLIGVLTGFAVFNAVTAVSASYLLTFGARLLAGVMGGTLWSMLAGYAARMVPAERRGRATAIVLAGITAAMAAGIPAGAALATVSGWRPIFALLAAVPLLLVAWVRWQVPALPGEAAPDRPSLRRVGSLPGIRTVLAVTVLLLTGHQAMYTYAAPFAARSGPGDASLVLFVFGAATLALGLITHNQATLLTAVALWGAAFGAAPTLLQTALIDASGPVSADVATSMQTTVYNIGIAAGSLAGGVILDHTGAAALPWATALLTTVALAIVAAARRHSFPATRPAHKNPAAQTAKTTRIGGSPKCDPAQQNTPRTG